MRKYEQDLEATDPTYHAKYYKHFAMHESKGLGYRCEYCPWHGGENRRTYRRHYSWKLYRENQYKVVGKTRKFKYNYLKYDPLFGRCWYLM